MDRKLESAIMEIGAHHFSHLPYAIMRDWCYEIESGFSERFDRQPYAYGGRFMNEVGGDILEFVAGIVGIDELERRAPQMHPDSWNCSDGWRLRTHPHTDDFVEFGGRLARAVIARIATVFPQVSVDELRLRFGEPLSMFAMLYAGVWVRECWGRTSTRSNS